MSGRGKARGKARESGGNTWQRAHQARVGREREIAERAAQLREEREAVEQGIGLDGLRTRRLVDQLCLALDQDCRARDRREGEVRAAMLGVRRY